MRVFLLITVFVAHNLLYSIEQPQVHIVSYSSYLLPNVQGPICYDQILEDFNVHPYDDLYQYVKNFQGDSPDLHKIVFFDYCEDPKMLSLPKKKLVCFKWEAIKGPSRFYEPYSRVYTFDDDLIDNIKYFKFYYPIMKPMIDSIPDFKEKKFSVMVAGNWLSERQDIARYFINKNPGLEVYGGRVPSMKNNNTYFQGKIDGYYSSDKKIKTLSGYKFCICFENTHTTPGYITEKIFDCFAAGCVPIYWGPVNTTEYIPKECFIDYRDFSSYEDLYQFLINMTEADYETYIKSIHEFLSSDKAYLFSPKYFEELLYQELLTP